MTFTTQNMPSFCLELKTNVNDTQLIIITNINELLFILPSTLSHA